MAKKDNNQDPFNDQVDRWTKSANDFTDSLNGCVNIGCVIPVAIIIILGLISIFFS